MTARSCAFPPLISAPLPRGGAKATIPSTLATKFANTWGRSGREVMRSGP